MTEFFIVFGVLAFVYYYILRKVLDTHYENYGSYSGMKDNTKMCASCGKRMNQTYRGEQTSTFCINCR